MLSLSDAARHQGGPVKATISREEFSRALGAVEHAVPGKSNLPILSHVLIEAADGQLKLRTTDLAVMIADKAPATVTEPGTITLPAQTFSGWLKLLDSSALVEITCNGNQAQVISGRSKSKYSTGNPEEFPPMPVIEDDAMVVEMDTKALGLALGEVLVAAASKLTRPECTALYVHATGSGLELATTDGFRLATTKLTDVAIEGDSEWEALIPADAMQEVQKLLKEATGRVRIAIGRAWAMVDIGPGGTVLYTRLIDSKFPPYMRVIEKADADVTSVVEVDRALLQKATRVSMLFGEGEVKPVKLETNETGWLDLKGLGGEHQSHESVPADFYKGDEMVARLNGVYLKDALDAMPDSRVVLSSGGPATPLVIRPAESTATTHLIMVLVGNGE